MPAYDFRCSKCEAEFEIERPFGAKGSVKCPKCGSLKTEKIFSATGVVFKGSGFYLTDSRSAKDKVTAAGGKGKGEEIKPAADTTDSKPAADSDSAPVPNSKAEKTPASPAKPEKKAKT